MTGIPDKIDTWQMVAPGRGGNPGKLARTFIDVPELADDEALVEIAGCGVCHTDLGLFLRRRAHCAETAAYLGA